MIEMTNRELLELAAKAAGIECGCDRIDSGVSITKNDGRHRHLPQWNPLTNDGDALRLAVKLRLPLSFPNKPTAKCTQENKYGFEAWVDCGRYWDPSHSIYYPHDERLSEDPYAATRRAIVRAAAEIGKHKTVSNSDNI